MLAVSSRPFDSAEYIYEVKWDGYRGLCYLDGNTVIRSRNLADLTGKFPELAGMHRKVSRKPAILDGEIVLFEKGKPSFAGLQSRGKISELKSISRASAERPVIFIAFDVLYCGGKSVMGLSLIERKRLLEEMVGTGEELVLSRYICGEGRKFFEACVKEGLEGAVAKKLNSVYLPGRRSAYWLKFRHTKEADLVICGYQYGPGGKNLGCLVLGGYHNGRLVYQGKVGTGFSSEEANALLEGLRRLEVAGETLQVPRAEKSRTRWVRPLLVCAVEYLEATAGGCLRHPVYRGLRRDKTPAECPAVAIKVWLDGT